MEISLIERKKLIDEAYEWQKEAAKEATKEGKADAYKKMRSCSVYATKYNIGRMSIFKFCEIINKSHPTTQFIIKIKRNEAT